MRVPAMHLRRIDDYLHPDSLSNLASLDWDICHTVVNTWSIVS